MSDGRVFTVFAAKGGCGKTTIATNLAVTLSALGAERVCVVDLDLEFRDIACMLGLRAQPSLCGATRWTGPMTRERVATLMTPFRPGLDCLVASTGPGDAARVTPAVVEELLGALRTLYDFVIVDTPAQLNGLVLAALDAADHHVLVATPERPSLKNLRLMLDVLDVLYDAGRRSLVINRSDVRAGLPASDVEHLVRNPITIELPNRVDIPASINRGEPVTLGCPDHPVSQALRTLVTHCLGRLD